MVLRIHEIRVDQVTQEWNRVAPVNHINRFDRLHTRNRVKRSRQNGAAALCERLKNRMETRRLQVLGSGRGRENGVENAREKVGNERVGLLSMPMKGVTSPSSAALFLMIITELTSGTCSPWTAARSVNSSRIFRELQTKEVRKWSSAQCR